MKRDYIKTYHQEGVNLKIPDQNTEFVFGESNNYQQIGNAYLHYDITVRNHANADFSDNCVKRSIKKFCFFFNKHD